MATNSKPVRVPDYLLELVDVLAARERRDRSNMVEVLLAEALEGRTGPDAVSRDGGGDAYPSQVGRDRGSESVQSGAPSAVSDDHFKPDFKSEKKK